MSSTSATNVIMLAAFRHRTSFSSACLENQIAPNRNAR